MLPELIATLQSRLKGICNRDEPVIPRSRHGVQTYCYTFGRPPSVARPPFFCTIQVPASGSHPIVPSGILQDQQTFVWRDGIRPIANFRALQQFLSGDISIEHGIRMVEVVELCAGDSESSV
jgi:hypothetical protein